MTSLTEETVYTSLHYPRGSMNFHSPHRPPLDPLSVIDPLVCLRDPWGSLRASLTTPALNQLTLVCYINSPKRLKHIFYLTI